MAKKIKDLAVVTGKYSYNGEEKSRWQNVGCILENEQDGSWFLSLNAFFNFSALPRKDGSDHVIIGLFDPKPRDYQNNSNSNSNNNSGIPF